MTGDVVYVDAGFHAVAIGPNAADA